MFQMGDHKLMSSKPIFRMPVLSQTSINLSQSELIIQQYLFSFVMQPSVSGMDPPFGDAFQNYTFADQALTSTDLLANSSDPDFIYELVSVQRFCLALNHLEHFI